jgi:hypothetical protein
MLTPPFVVMARTLAPPAQRGGDVLTDGSLDREGKV